MSFDATTQDALQETEVTTLHLFRHGKVDVGGARRAYGHMDYPLSDLGRRQSAALVDFARRELPKPAGIISSDLGRCLATARPLAQALGVPLQASDQLREQHMGDWEGRTWESLTREDKQGILDYWTNYHDVGPPNGESYREMARRIDRWWDASFSALRGRRWILVTHIGVLRALCCRFLGVPVSDALRFAPMYGSHTQFLLSAPGAVLQVLGAVPAGLAEPVVGTDARQNRGDRPPRLALSGSAGIGKTTLARALAERLGVPYIPEGMRERLEAGLNLHELGHAGLKVLLLELWGEQVEREDAAIRSVGGFVSDRSCWDYAAFWLHYHFTEDSEGSERLFGQIRERSALYDRILLLPWGALPLLADGYRSSNAWLQRHYQAAVEGLLYREHDPTRLAVMPPLTDLDARIRWGLAQVG